MIERKLKNVIKKMLKSFRIVAINGPRQSGKTTLQKTIANENDMGYFTFDDSKTLQTALSNPEDFISYITEQKSAAIDEVQMVPNVIPAIKMKVDEANKKGMFLLTGSSDMFKNSKIKESLAGRMVSFNLYPLSYAEINGKDINIIDKLFSDDFNTFDDKSISRKDFLNAIVNGGYPEVYTLDEAEKSAWFEFYIKARISKDIASLENVHPQKIANLDKLLNALANQTSSLINYSNIAKNISISEKTVQKYIQLLEALFIIKLVPSFANNRLKRITKAPKVHFIDTALASFLLNENAKSLLEGSQYVGNLTENFIFTELIKHQTWAETDTKIYHFRDAYKNEVDFILESRNGDIVALEVKSGSHIKKEHFKGLVAFAKSINKNFKGIVLYGGDEILPYSVDGYRFWIVPFGVFF